jgi:hypothetical protein
MLEATIGAWTTALVKPQTPNPDMAPTTPSLPTVAVSIPCHQCDRRRPSFRIRLHCGITFSLEVCDLQQQQFDAGEFTQQLCLQSPGQWPSVACHQPVKPGSPIFVQRIIASDPLASEQTFDSIDVLDSLPQQCGAFT